MSTAKPLKLIPLDLYNKLIALHMGNTASPTPPPPAQTTTPQVEEYDDAGERQESIDAIISMLGKPYKRKAHVILEVGNIPFQRKSLRVVYSDGELGSHVIDLLQYVLSAPMIRKNIKNVPVDVSKFLEMLQSSPAIPRSMFASIPKKKIKKLNWITVA